MGGGEGVDDYKSRGVVGEHKGVGGLIEGGG